MTGWAGRGLRRRAYERLEPSAAAVLGGLVALRDTLESVVGAPAMPAVAGPGLRVAAATTVPRSSPAPDGPVRRDGPYDGGGAAVPDPGAAIPTIVAQAQAGDPQAFGQLYDHYANLVYRYLYYRVGNATLAEDLTSETFLRALRRIDSFVWQGRDFGAWLVTIARNLTADHFKSARYRLEVTTADLISAGVDGRSESPEREVLERVANAALLEAVRQLNPEQQECVVLRFLEGLSVAETARVMGKNDGAIKALQYRAVRSLGRLLPDGMRW